MQQDTIGLFIALFTKSLKNEESDFKTAEWAEHVQTPLETGQTGQKFTFSYEVIIVSYRDHMEPDKNSWDEANSFRHELSLTNHQIG